MEPGIAHGQKRRMKRLNAAAAKLHTVARSQENPTYPQRYPVPDEKVPWETPYTDYAPVEYFFEGHRGKPFADAADVPAAPTGARFD